MLSVSPLRRLPLPSTLSCITQTITRSLSSTSEGLTDSQLADFHKDGFLVIPEHLSRTSVNEMRTQMDVLLNAFEPETVSVFSTKEQTRTSDDYFLGSGDKIRYFFEENAFNEDGSLKNDVSLSINKVGHALHDLDPVFRRHTYTQQNAAIYRSLGFEAPTIVQSMYITKQPGIGGEVGAHQDGSFLYTKPQTCVGMWWALEDCSPDNGCLWAVPGSQNLGVSRRFMRDPSGVGTTFDPPEPETWDLTGAVPLEIPSGSLVLLHNALVHGSEPNESGRSRHAYSIHVVDSRKGVEYPADNWLQTATRFHTFEDYDEATDSFRDA